MPGLNDGDMNVAKQLQADFKRTGTFLAGGDRGGRNKTGPLRDSGAIRATSNYERRGTPRLLTSFFE